MPIGNTRPNELTKKRLVIMRRNIFVMHLDKPYAVFIRIVSYAGLLTSPPNISRYSLGRYMDTYSVLVYQSTAPVMWKDEFVTANVFQVYAQPALFCASITFPFTFFSVDMLGKYQRTQFMNVHVFHINNLSEHNSFFVHFHTICMAIGDYLVDWSK